MSREVEYNALRAEIREYQSRQFTMVSFAITATVTLIGYGTTNKNALVLVTPILILTLVLLQLVRNIFHIFRVGTYIRAFIKPNEVSLNWETYSRQFRILRTGQERLVHFRHDLPSYEVVLISTGWACIILSFIFSIGYEFLVPLLLAIYWLIFWTMIRRRIKYQTSGQLEIDLDLIWAEAAKASKTQQSLNIGG